jgi:hypothetical protein
LEQAGAAVELVVRGPAPAGLSADAVAEMVGLTAAANLRPDGALAAALDVGEPPSADGPLGRFAGAWLASLRSGARAA